MINKGMNQVAFCCYYTVCIIFWKNGYLGFIDGNSRKYRYRPSDKDKYGDNIKQL